MRATVGTAGLKPPGGQCNKVLSLCRGRAGGLLVAALLTGAFVLDVSANGFRLGDQDAFATARGEAFTATADNASAIYYNPAGIAQLEGANVRGGAYGIYLTPEYRPPDNKYNHTQTYGDTDKYEAIPQFFYTYTPQDMPVSFGFGSYSPYGSSASWPQDTGFRTVALKGSLKYITLSPVMALKLAPNFFIGGGLMVNYTSIDLEQGLLKTPNPFHNFFRYTGDGWSVGDTLGALWQPVEQVSIGATFRSPATVTTKGRTVFEQEPVIRGTHRIAQADFTFPLTTVVGISYRPTPKWNMEFDADYTDWSSIGTVYIQQVKPPFPFRKRTKVSLDWQPSWMFELGVTRYFAGGWHASAGYILDENSVPNQYYTPLAADLDRHFFSAGAGFSGKVFSVDLAYQFGYGPDRTVTGSTPSSTPARFAGQSADGTYSFTSQAVILSVGMHF